MEEEIQIIVNRKPGRYWWNTFIVISINKEISMTYEEVKQRVIDLSIELGEYDRYSDTNVMGVRDFYNYELSSEFIDINNINLTEEERKFLVSLFPRFCENLGIFQTGFVITIDVFSGTYTQTVQILKDEILHSDPKYK